MSRRRGGPTSAPGMLRGRRAVLASGAWVAVSQLLPFLATGVLSVVAGRVLGPDLLGKQSFIAFVAALVAALAIGSLTDATIQTLAATVGRGEDDRVWDEAWPVRAHGLVGLVVGVLLAAYGFLLDQFLVAWLLVGLGALVDALGWGYAAPVIATSGWGPVARRRLVSQLCAVALGVAAVIVGWGVTGIFAANVLASVGLLAWSRAAVPSERAPRRGRAPWTLPVPVRRTWLVFALGEVLTQVVGRRIELLFLAASSTTSEMAAYSIAVMVVSAAATVPASLAGAAMPRVAAALGAGQHELAHAALGRALRVTAVASLPLTAVLVAVGPPLVRGFYGGDFGRAADLVPLLALSVLAAPCGYLCAAFWSAAGSVRLAVLAGLVGGAVDLLLAFLLVPHQGAVGAACASVAGQALDAVVLVALTCRAVRGIRLGARAWSAALLVAGLAASAGTAAAHMSVGLPAAALALVTVVAVLLAASAIATALRRPLLDSADVEWLSGTLPPPLSRWVTRLLLVRVPRPGEAVDVVLSAEDC